MRKLFLPGLFFCLLLLMAACGGESSDVEPVMTPEPTPTPEPVKEAYALDLCLGVEWYTLDPTFINDADTATYAAHLFEGLMKYVPSDRAERISTSCVAPGMAESYSVSEDGLTYTFTIRDNACWSDGEPVRAQDFVYAWQRLLSSDEEETLEHARSGRILSGVVKNAAYILEGKQTADQLGMTALDERTLEIRLEEPCSYFIKLCASPCLVPLRQDIIEAYGGNWTDADKIVTNGAYLMSDWVHDDYLAMEQNPDYYDRDALGPQTILWHFSDGEALTLQGFRDGDYDAIGTFPESETTTLKEEGLCETLEEAGTYYLYYNTDVITDWRVRAAMTLTLDRDTLVAQLPGEESAATGFVASGIQDSHGHNFSSGGSGGQPAMYSWLQNWYPDHDLNTYEGRCELAKELYQEALDAGTWHQSYQLTFLYNDSTTNSMVADLCQKNWTEILEMNVYTRVVSREAYASLLKNGDFGIACLSWISDYDDAQNFLSLMGSGSDYNYGRWSSAAFDDLLEKIHVAPDPLERDELQYYAETLLFSMGGFPVCPVYFFEDTCAVSQSLSGVGYSPFGYFSFQYAQIND